MKIFNWVHRRFNNKENAKKNGAVVGDDEKQFVADNISNTNVIERWRGGILSIGTFGYDTLKDENDVYFYKGKDQTNLEEILSNHEISSDDSDHLEEDEESEEEYEYEYEQEEEEEEEPLVCATDFEELIEMQNEEGNKLEFEYVMMEKKVRTTLADLFIADSEEMKSKQGEIIKEKRNNSSKNGYLFGKKLAGNHDEAEAEARPIHKLHKLMRRMLKRKIHPDVGANANNSKVLVRKCDSTDDYASLLPTKDAII